MPANPSRENFTFGGWVTGGGAGTPFLYSTPVTGNITARATWTFTQPEPGSQHVFYLTLTPANMASTQFTGDRSWLDALATPSTGAGGELVLSFDVSNPDAGNSDNPRQRAMIGFDDLQTAIINAPGGSLAVVIEGESDPDEGTNFRWGLITSPAAGANWNASNLTVGQFSSQAFREVNITREQGRQYGWLMIETLAPITATTPTVTLRSIRFTVDF